MPLELWLWPSKYSREGFFSCATPPEKQAASRTNAATASVEWKLLVLDEKGLTEFRKAKKSMAGFYQSPLCHEQKISSPFLGFQRICLYSGVLYIQLLF